MQIESSELQLLQDWWKKYSSFAIGVMLLTVVLSVAYHYHGRRAISYQQQAASFYNNMFSALVGGKQDEYVQLGTQLIKDYPNSIYAGLASLLLAKSNLLSGEVELAEARLSFVVDKVKETKIRQIARLRLARVLIDRERFQEALSLLSKIDDDGYLNKVSELRADALLGLGKTKEAHELYLQVKERDEHSSLELELPLLELKLQQSNISDE
jgi:Uncharacterized protein conserved in bacteria